ncbi:formin-like protein 6 [Iris pallida]|uniref:Formin-like protein 6 n=1 Tax=Iris pallida TaxID=29817 RepID=A0AAX6HB51_IRIPA|nr:formin-like protein 6 [Iris pallida]
MARRHRKGAELEVAPARRRCSKIRQSWQSGSGSASGDKGHRGFLRRDRRRGTAGRSIWVGLLRRSRNQGRVSPDSTAHTLQQARSLEEATSSVVCHSGGRGGAHGRATERGARVQWLWR